MAAAQHEPYSSRVQDFFSSPVTSPASSECTVKLMELLRQPDKNKSKFFYSNGEGYFRVQTQSYLVAFAADDQAFGREAICVIENISPASIEELGSACDLDPGFFVGHANNPNPKDLWTNHSAEYDIRKYRGLYEVFEYHGMR